MSAGTITLTNKSAVVSGNGTSFTTDLAAGDFIVATVGGIAYTLPVLSINSATSLTLVSNFTGPTQSGNAWNAVPRVALNMVTAALVTQSAEALRGLNYDKQNWESVFTGTGTITVTLPDGSTFSGPSWKYLSDNMATKSNGAVPINQGGTGAKTATEGLQNLGGIPLNGDAILTGKKIFRGGGSLVTQPSGDWAYTSAQIISETRAGVGRIRYGGYWANSTDYTFNITMLDANGANEFRALGIYPDGNAYFYKNIQCVSLTQTSDKTKKTNIKTITDPLDKISAITGVTFNWLSDGQSSAGVIAQDVKEVLPEIVREITDENEDVSLSLEYAGLIGLCIEAIKALSLKVDDNKSEPASIIGNDD